MKKAGITISEYSDVHRWIKHMRGKAYKCENPHCKYPRVNAHKDKVLAPLRFEWSNISKQYKKELTDWIMLCPSCHRQADYLPSYKRNRRVTQYDLAGNKIKTWKSLRYAANSLGILTTSIHNCVTKRSKYAGGYVWK